MVETDYKVITCYIEIKKYFNYIKMYDIVDYVRILNTNNLDMVIKFSKNLYAEIEKKKVCNLQKIVKRRNKCLRRVD